MGLGGGGCGGRESNCVWMGKEGACVVHVVSQDVWEGATFHLTA